MKAKLPQPEHTSYARHRKQRNLQIILPVVLSAVLMLLCVVALSFATFNADGDVARWAAVSAIWIAIPILIGKLITLALLVALVYGMARLLNLLPQYTLIAQDYIYVARSYIIRGAEAVSKSAIEADSAFATVKTFFKRIFHEQK